jgi:hypothetical protein
VLTGLICARCDFGVSQNFHSRGVTGKNLILLGLAGLVMVLEYFAPYFYYMGLAGVVRHA